MAAHEIIVDEQAGHEVPDQVLQKDDPVVAQPDDARQDAGHLDRRELEDLLVLLALFLLIPL